MEIGQYGYRNKYAQCQQKRLQKLGPFPAHLLDERPSGNVEIRYQKCDQRIDDNHRAKGVEYRTIGVNQWREYLGRWSRALSFEIHPDHEGALGCRYNQKPQGAWPCTEP